AAEDCVPDVAPAHVRGNVYAGSLPLHARNVFAQGRPVSLDSHRFEALVETRRGGAQDRPGRVRFTQDLGGHTLADFALGLAVGQKVEIGVTVEVDETGRHNQPRSADHPLRRRVDQPTDARNPPVLDRHRTLEPGTPAAVDDVSVNDQQVVLVALSALLRHVANGEYAQ